MDVQMQLNIKQADGSYLLTSGGTMTGDTNASHYVNWTNQYGCKWTNGGLNNS